ncbi:membrane-bound lytic murein transglycosylase B [uncultured Thiomicrorhabdus sp.]
MDRKQPEFTRTFFEYLNRAVSKTRIENGRENHVQNMKLLKAVEEKYGVPSAYLVAFWGMETNYGGYTGYDPIIQSLATLAFDPRRSEFFSKELIAALTILDRGDVSLSDMQALGPDQWDKCNLCQPTICVTQWMVMETVKSIYGLAPLTHYFRLVISSTNLAGSAAKNGDWKLNCRKVLIYP